MPRFLDAIRRRSELERASWRVSPLQRLASRGRGGGGNHTAAAAAATAATVAVGGRADRDGCIKRASRVFGRQRSETGRLSALRSWRSPRLAAFLPRSLSLSFLSFSRFEKGRLADPRDLSLGVATFRVPRIVTRPSRVPETSSRVLRIPASALEEHRDPHLRDPVGHRRHR